MPCFPEYEVCHFITFFKEQYIYRTGYTSRKNVLGKAILNCKENHLVIFLLYKYKGIPLAPYTLHNLHSLSVTLGLLKVLHNSGSKTAKNIYYKMSVCVENNATL